MVSVLKKLQKATFTFTFYLGALWADVLAVCRGEVPSSEEFSVVDSINCWLMYGSS